MSIILWILKNPLLSICLVALAAATAFGTWNYVAKEQVKVEVASVRADNARLSTQKEILEKSVNVLNEQVTQAKQAQDELSKTITTLTASQNRDTETIKEIANAKPTDDGPVAPVLLRALERMRKQ